MTDHGLLAIALDDEIVLLDQDRGTLFLLDTWASRVWQACEGPMTDVTMPPLLTPAARVRETLLALVGAGVIRRDGPLWVRRSVTWV